MVGGDDLAHLVFIEELAPFLSRLDFKVDFLTEEEEAVEEAFFPPVEGTAPFEEAAFILRKEEEAVEQAFFPPDEDTAPLEEDDFILLISAIKALARFLTMTSRSGCFDLLPEDPCWDDDFSTDDRFSLPTVLCGS